MIAIVLRPVLALRPVAIHQEAAHVPVVEAILQAVAEDLPAQVVAVAVLPAEAVEEDK